MAVASPVTLSTFPTIVKAAESVTDVPTPLRVDASAGIKHEPDNPVLESAPAAGETELVLVDDELPRAALRAPVASC